MQNSDTITLLRTKVLKIIGLLLLVRLSLYIPVPSVELDIFSQGQEISPMFGFARTLTGSSCLGIGALGILPYINSSIIIQLLSSVLPNLEKLQKEEGELGRQKINKYTRYLTFLWAVILSTVIAFLFVKPVIFNWSLFLAAKIILSLTTGSLLSMWFAELITNENLGNGSSMIIFINIVGSIPTTIIGFTSKLKDGSYFDFLSQLSKGIFFYLIVVFIIVLFQDAYKKITIVSAKQLNASSIDSMSLSQQEKSSYIPIKLNQGGIMPLVFSSTIATFVYYPLQLIVNSTRGIDSTFLASVLASVSLSVNIFLVIFFSNVYALIVLKPNDIAQNLAKLSYTIPSVRQGDQTIHFLKQTISRLAFMGGLFLAFLAFSPIILGNFFQFTLFRNLTSLLILIGVITDTTSQIRGFLISRNYEGFRNT